MHYVLQSAIRLPTIARLVAVMLVALPLGLVSAQQSPVPPPPQAALPLVLGPGARAVPGTPTPGTPTPGTPTPGTPTTNLLVSTATYLGGAGNDVAQSVAFAANGDILVGGAFPGYAPAGITPTGAGDGAVVRLDPTGRAVRSVTRLGSAVLDLEYGGNQLVACGAFGLAFFEGGAETPSTTSASAARCATGSDTTTAALHNKRVTVYTRGTESAAWEVGGSTVNDLAVDSVNQQIIVTGFTQDDGGACGPLQIAWLRAYSYTGQLKWQRYNWNKQQVGNANVCADTRGERVSIGADGKLYFAGSINGGTGASIFARNPQNLNAELDGSQLVNIDKYTNAFNTGSIKMGWIGRFDPGSGALLVSQGLLTRASGDKGNSLSIKAIAADASGRVFLAGDAACCIKERNGTAGATQTLAVAGTAIGNYESGEAYLLALSADFRTRLAWTVFAAPNASGGGSPADGIAVRDGVVVLVATLNLKAATNRALITYQALQERVGGAADGYLVRWPLP